MDISYPLLFEDPYRAHIKYKEKDYYYVGYTRYFLCYLGVTEISYSITVQCMMPPYSEFNAIIHSIHNVTLLPINVTNLCIIWFSLVLKTFLIAQ